MKIFTGFSFLSRLISKNCMNGILPNLSDHSYPDILHALQTAMARGPWEAAGPGALSAP